MEDLTDAGIIGLADRCPAITDINVRECENLTDEAIIGLADRCPAITNIDLSYCRNLTDAAIIGLADRCPTISDIDLSSLANLTYESFFVSRSRVRPVRPARSTGLPSPPSAFVRSWRCG